MSGKIRLVLEEITACAWALEDVSTPADRHPRCHVTATDPTVPKQIREHLDQRTKLIEYHVTYLNYSRDPLEINSTHLYRPKFWARIANPHGRTLLSLAFNYGVLSLMTLRFGVVTMNIELEDSPAGCLLELSEEEKVDVLLHTMTRDFDDQSQPVLQEGEAVCHQVMYGERGFAHFSDRCCEMVRLRSVTSLYCDTQQPNFWLRLLNGLCITLKVLCFMFGPMLIPSSFYANVLDENEYKVKMNDFLRKTVCVSRSGRKPSVRATHTLDLRMLPPNRFRECQRLLEQLPEYKVIPIKVNEYRLDVQYKRLMTENKVPVGLLREIANTLFMCKLSEVGPFTECCRTSMLGPSPRVAHLSWLSACRLLGMLLLVLALPLPYYLRVLVYYLYEYPEVYSRSLHAARHGLRLHYNFNLLQYLSPTHGLFLFIYALYFVSALSLAVRSAVSHKQRFRKLILGSFVDMTRVSWLTGLGMMIQNMLWPFKRFGLCGFAVAVVYWPLVLPVSAVVFVVYCMPLLYLTFRMIVYSKLAICSARDARRGLHTQTRLERKLDRRFRLSELGGQHSVGVAGDTVHSIRAIQRQTLSPSPLRVWMDICVATVAILALYGTMLLLAECVGFFVEIMIFTMMGIIVNAGTVLKFFSLTLLIIIYSYDSFRHVHDKYVKLNKALFSEIKGRIKAWEEVVSMPSHLQENRGFKAQEMSEQGDHEVPDDVTSLHPPTMLINDLILFFDRNDTPRIPRRLFEATCGIQVSGAPGPVYLSLLRAVRSVLVIILFLGFVFLVVLTFGDFYRVSSTNQTLATLAGGFLPLILRNLCPRAPDVELGTVSFKSKLGEIIQNFKQKWPINDLVFDIDMPEDADSSQDQSDINNENQTEKRKQSPPMDIKLNNQVHQNLNRIHDVDKIPKKSIATSRMTPPPSPTEVSSYVSACEELRGLDTEEVQQFLEDLPLAQPQQEVDLLLLAPPVHSAHEDSVILMVESPPQSPVTEDIDFHSV